MENKTGKRVSLTNLVTGYVLTIAFVLLIMMNRSETKEIVMVDTHEVNATVIKQTLIEPEVVYVDRPVYREPTRYVDHLDGVVVKDNDTVHIATIKDDVAVDIDRDINILDGYEIHDRVGHSGVHNHHDVVQRGARPIGDATVDRRVTDERVGVVDRDAYDRAIRQDDILSRRLKELEEIDLDEESGLDVSKLTLARDDDTDLGEIDINFDEEGYGISKGGQLYAYNFPSQGVGAGIGNSALGAGVGGGAGLGAGIGQAVSSGDTVPALGGVGTYPLPAEPGQETSPGTGGGVGGLVAGSGAGGAAGLVTGMVTAPLGVAPGAPGTGGYGTGGRGYDYDHLPKDGALHIMIHVDGSGSLLSTRAKLDEMKQTLLKQALLPYYNNDETLYDKRVTIIDSSGERTLQFFTQAAHKDNVLAIAFQDEAAPDYHLPNFNKTPQNAYSTDLRKLKYLLSEYKGVYRGIMFQVDRGRTFSKSFKELVECAWNGEGYLSEENLKKYHRDNNLSHIRNKHGVVFSDEYHAKSEGEPQYYLDLIFQAASRVGIDLNIYGAGTTDGTYTDGL